MNDAKTFDWGIAAGVFGLAAAWTGHWAITPRTHPETSNTVTALAMVQSLVLLVIAFLIVRRHRPTTKTLAPNR
jgi:hypothetical protein